MSRTKGSKNKTYRGNGAPRKARGPKVTAHDNLAKEPLTDEQRQALTHSWAAEYTVASTRKKTADADLKNICKKAKSEGVLLKEIQDYLAAETEEGQTKLRVDAERITRIARWRNFSIGHQFGMFDDLADESRSFTAGKEEGMAGHPANPSENYDAVEYMRGWHAGQGAKITAGIKASADWDAAGEELSKSDD